MATKQTVGRRPGDKVPQEDAAADAAKRRAAFLRLQQEHIAKLKADQSGNPAVAAQLAVEEYVPEKRRSALSTLAAPPAAAAAPPVAATTSTAAPPAAAAPAVAAAATPGATSTTRRNIEENRLAESVNQQALDPSKLPQDSQDYLAQLKAAKTPDEKATLMTDREVVRAKTIKDLEDTGDASRARADKIIHDEERRQEAWEKDRTPPEGAPEDVKGTFSALSGAMRHGVRSITNPEGTTPAGAYTALFGAASGNPKYALGVAGGDLGPNPALAGQRAGERARGVRPGDTAAIGDVGGQVIAPKVTENALPKNATPEQKATFAKKQAETEARAVKVDTRVKETTARATTLKTRADAIEAEAHKAALAGDIKKATEMQTYADTLRGQADEHLKSVEPDEAQAKSIREEAMPQPAGVRTTKKIQARTGMPEDQARRVMEHGDIGPGSARLPRIMRALEAGTAMTGGVGQAAPYVYRSDRAEEMVRRLENEPTVGEAERTRGIAAIQANDARGKYGTRRTQGPQNIGGATNLNTRIVERDGRPYTIEPGADGRPELVEVPVRGGLNLGGFQAPPQGKTYGPDGTVIGTGPGAPQVAVGAGGVPGAAVGAPAAAPAPFAAPGEKLPSGFVAASPEEVAAVAAQFNGDAGNMEAALNANGKSGVWQMRK